jgi:hypothetical protein
LCIIFQRWRSEKVGAVAPSIPLAQTARKSAFSPSSRRVWVRNVQIAMMSVEGVNGV